MVSYENYKKMYLENELGSDTLTCVMTYMYECYAESVGDKLDDLKVFFEFVQAREKFNYSMKKHGFRRAYER